MLKAILGSIADGVEDFDTVVQLVDVRTSKGIVLSGKKYVICDVPNNEYHLASDSDISIYMNKITDYMYRLSKGVSQKTERAISFMSKVTSDILVDTYLVDVGIQKGLDLYLHWSAKACSQVYIKSYNKDGKAYLCLWQK